MAGHSRDNRIRYQSGGNSRRNSHAVYYTEGNTVRKAEAVPRSFAYTAQRRASAIPAELPSRETGRERRRQAERQAVQKTQRLSNARRVDRSELSIDLPFLLLLTAAVVATLVICYNYLRLTASIDAHMDNIERLETTLEDMRTENDALEQSIDTSVDLNYVYNVAVNELGMIHAGKDNMITYDKTESEYVRQYENIPKN